MKRIAIFGANGNLGRQAAIAFKKGHWQVRTVTRNGKYGHLDGVEMASADALNQQQMIDAAKDCDFILNAINPPYPKWPAQCLTIAQNIMAAARAHNCIHLFPGNVYNYGREIPTFIDENTPFVADHAKAKIRIDMERIFEQNATQNNVKTIIVRTGDFFGGAVKGSSWFDLEISKKLRKGKITYPGPLAKVHAWVYLPDLAQVFLKLAENCNTLSNFEVFALKGYAVTGTQFRSSVEAVVGNELQVGNIPWPILRILGIFVPMLKDVWEMSYLWRLPHEIYEQKLKKQIGDIPYTPLETALAQSLVNLGMEDLVQAPISPQLLANAS